MEWRLKGDEPRGPDRPWMDLENQPGFQQRAQLVADLVALMAALRPGLKSVTDLGCGDGSLMTRLPRHLAAWGYEIGRGDVAAGRDRGLDVRSGDIVTGIEHGEIATSIEYGDILVASEVLEHLDNPVEFLSWLPDRFLVASSPSRETGDWHNPIHSWAWDLDGYRGVFARAGWRVLYQAECDGGLNTFGGVTGQQKFQAVVAVRP